jgi:MGT family glycosyltransferase
MSRFWFVSAPLISHTDWGGFLATAHALQTAGHEVLWVSSAGLRSWIKRAGIKFEAVEDTGWLWPPPPAPDLSKLTPPQAMTQRYTRAIDTWLSVDRVAVGVKCLIDLVDRLGAPDVIASDPFLSAVALAAEARNIPVAMCGWPAQAELDPTNLFPVQRDLGFDSQNRIRQLCEQFHLQGIHFAQSATPSIVSRDLHICYFPPSWYAAEQSTLLANNRFVGGVARVPNNAPPSWLTEIPSDKGIGLVTLGTIFTGDPGFFSWAAHAVAREGLVPVVSIGMNPIEREQKDALIAALPRGTRLLNWVPFDHVLPRTLLAIHHGGMGTTHQLLIHGVPQIVVPHAADQRVQAKRVSQAKVGLNLSAHDVRNGRLWEGTKAILKDERVQQAARNYAGEMAALGGAAKAAEYLEYLALQKVNSQA